MANNQFPMYVVKASPAWAGLKPNAGITARDIASLTTYMRETLHEAMGEAVVQAQRTSSIRSRRGRLFANIMTGRRPRGSGHPSTVSNTFMFRPWMAIHETGGRIQPKSSRYLTLPMPAAMRVDGRLKRRSARGWKDYGTFVYTTKSRKKFLVYKDKRTKKLVFLYHLVKHVDMKKRIDLRSAILLQEFGVVQAWSEYVLEIFNSLDLYGMAFRGVTVQ